MLTTLRRIHTGILSTFLSYIHSEAYAAGELKHGPIALIEQNVPVIGIATNQLTFEKTLNNLEEAANGEAYEWTDMYAEFAKTAKEEGFDQASGAFDKIDTQIAGLGEISAIQDLYVAHSKAAIDGKSASTAN